MMPCACRNACSRTETHADPKTTLARDADIRDGRTPHRAAQVNPVLDLPATPEAGSSGDVLHAEQGLAVRGLCPTRSERADLSGREAGRVLVLLPARALSPSDAHGQGNRHRRLRDLRAWRRSHRGRDSEASEAEAEALTLRRLKSKPGPGPGLPNLGSGLIATSFADGPGPTGHSRTTWSSAAD